MWLPTADGDSIELYSYVNRHNQLFNLACNLRGHCAVTFSFGRAVRLARQNSSAALTGLHMWFMPGPVSWPYHIAYSYKSSRQCIFAYDWHPFRFSCIVFSGPQMRSIGRSVSTYSHRPVCTIYRCTARPPVAPAPHPLSLCCPLAFHVLSLFDAPFLRQISALFVHYWPRYTSLLNELLSKWMYATLVYLLTNTTTYSNSNSYAANRIDLASPRLVCLPIARP